MASSRHLRWPLDVVSLLVGRSCRVGGLGAKLLGRRQGLLGEVRAVRLARIRPRLHSCQHYQESPAAGHAARGPGSLGRRCRAHRSQRRRMGPRVGSHPRTWVRVPRRAVRSRCYRSLGAGPMAIGSGSVRLPACDARAIDIPLPSQAAPPSLAAVSRVRVRRAGNPGALPGMWARPAPRVVRRDRRSTLR